MNGSPRTDTIGHAAHYNAEGIDLCWQSESPRSVSIRGWKPGRKRAIGEALTARFGGTWRYVTGPGGPGQWSGDNLTPAQIVRVAEHFGATIVCYLYADHGIDVIPVDMDGSPAYKSTGYYSTPAN